MQGSWTEPATLGPILLLAFCVIPFVFYRCCYKVPQIEWLCTVPRYYLIVLQVLSPKRVSLESNQGACGAEFLLEAPGKNLFPCLSQLRDAATGPTTLFLPSLRSQRQRAGLLSQGLAPELLPPFLLIGTPVITRTVQHPLSISTPNVGMSAKSLLPRRFGRLGCESPWRPLSCLHSDCGQVKWPFQASVLLLQSVFCDVLNS